MDNKKKIIFCIVAGIIFIIAFILNLLFPPKAFIKSAHAVEGSLDNAIEYFLDHPEVPLSDLVQDEEHYNYLKDYAASRYSVELPAWESSGTNDDVYNFFRNIASGFIGQYAYPDESNLTALIGSVNDLNDFLDLIDFDSETGEFIATPANGSGIVDLVNHSIYVTPSGGQIGNWRPLPVYDIYFSPWPSIANQFVNVEGNSCYIASAPNSYIIAYKGSQVAGSNVRRDGVGGYQYYSCNEFYQGSLDSGYYVSTYGYGVVSGLTSYSDVSTALADFFGNDSSADPVLTGAIIVNDNPTFSPISLPSAGVYDYSTKIVNNYDNDDDTPISYKVLNYQPYNYTYTIPYDDTEYELPIYPEIPHDLPEVTFDYPEITANEEIQEGMNGLSPLWVTLLTMGGSFIVLKVIL